MASERRKAKDRAKIEAFRQRVAGRQCAVDECFKSTQGGSRYCTPHNGRYLRTGNPLSVIPEAAEYAAEVEQVKDLMRHNPNHSAPRAGIKFLRAWLNLAIKAVASRESTHQGFRTKCPAERPAVLAIQRGIRMQEMLVTMAGAVAYLSRTQRCQQVRNELARTVAIIGLRVIGNNEDAKGHRYGWHNGVVRELAAMMARGSLMTLMFNMADGVRKMQDQELKLVQRFGKPMKTPQMYRPTRTIKPFTFYSFEEVTTHTE